MLMGKDLSHLNSSEIESLMRRYYDGEAVSKLLKEYDITVPASGLYKLFPPEVYPNYTCEYCGENLVVNRPPKTMKDALKYERDLYCPACGHQPFQDKCRCEHCIEKERLLEMKQLAQIQEVYSRPRTPVNFSNLSFTNKVFLGALCRALLRENLYEISPYNESEIILTPTPELRKRLYSDLIKNQVVTVSPQSPLSAFDANNESFPNIFYTYEVTYNLNLVLPPIKQELFNEILNPSYYSKSHAAEALALWKEIAIAECIEYLQYQLKAVGFAFSPGEKTHKVFDIILNDFSVSQIYGIIWRAVASASKSYLESSISKKHAANSVIGACERYAENAKINGWDLKQYNRIKDLPQSILSEFYFNRVLSIGDMGFRIPPPIV
jgi:hypothetical protein